MTGGPVTSGGVTVHGNRVTLQNELAEGGDRGITVTIGKYRAEVMFDAGDGFTYGLTAPRKDAARFALALITLLMEAEAAPS